MNKRNLIVEIINRFDFGNISEEEFYSQKRDTFDALRDLTEQELVIKLAQIKVAQEARG